MRRRCTSAVVILSCAATNRPGIIVAIAFRSVATESAMEEKIMTIGQIIGVMRDYWDLPADCNDGELFTYAEILLDRIGAGEEPEALCAYLANVQVEKLKMPMSDAYRQIVDGSIALVRDLR
jgi:hypothetical protein